MTNCVHNCNTIDAVEKAIVEKQVADNVFDLVLWCYDMNISHSVTAEEKMTCMYAFKLSLRKLRFHYACREKSGLKCAIVGPKEVLLSLSLW